MYPYAEQRGSRLTRLDWTILDQVAVAALITSNDALAKVLIDSVYESGLRVDVS
jgi:hypothetical protein